MPLPLMKNVGVPDTPLRSAESMSLSILASPLLRRSRVNCSMSRPSSRVPDQVFSCQRALVIEQDLVHWPELALHRRGFGGLGRELGVRVDIGERQVPPHIAQVTVIGQSSRTTGSAWPQ